MKSIILKIVSGVELLIVMVLVVFALCQADLSFGACPEAPNDNGLCDTVYVELYPSDTLFSKIGELIRVPIYVTHDIYDPMVDSIPGFMIPLCFWDNNPSKYCSVSYYWNNTTVYPSPHTDRSIFRHLDGATNWMMSLSERGLGEEWDLRIVQLDGVSHFWFYTVAVSIQDRLFAEGSRVLLATMTFNVQDTMTICIDSCFWPPSDRLVFSRSDAVTYIPRHNLPYCFSLSYRVGDITMDGVIELADVVYLISYLYRDGPAPNPLQMGDANCDGVVDLGDVVFLIKYVYKNGPVPAC